MASAQLVPGPRPALAFPLVVMVTLRAHDLEIRSSSSIISCMTSRPAVRTECRV